MATIEVYRGDGLRIGAPIGESMLSDGVLLDRGRAEMDANAHPLNQVSADVVFAPGLRLGQLVEALDPSTAMAMRAKITGVSITVTLADISQQITLEQPR